MDTWNGRQEHGLVLSRGPGGNTLFALRGMRRVLAAERVRQSHPEGGPVGRLPVGPVGAGWRAYSPGGDDNWWPAIGVDG